MTRILSPGPSDVLVGLALLLAAGCHREARVTRPEVGAFTPASMKAARISGYGHAEAVTVEEVEVPTPGPGQVLLEVHASSINPVDISVREGRRRERFPLRLPVTLGWDVAGLVRRLGPGVTTLQPGQKVYGQASVVTGGSGAFAEYATAPAALLSRMPRNLGFTEAASLPIVGVSALQGIDSMKLQRGQKVLIHGGGGGIGSVAIQIAKSLGAHVATTATGDDLAFARQLGADEVIDYRTQRFDQLLSGYDAVFDNVGGETYTRSFKVLKPGGVLVSMTQPPNTQLMQRYGVTALGERTSTTTEALDRLTGLIEAGVVTPHVDRAYPLDRIRDAFEDKERGGGRVRGKIAIVVIR
jgi:alcohol dehydrogenase